MPFLTPCIIILSALCTAIKNRSAVEHLHLNLSLAFFSQTNVAAIRIGSGKDRPIIIDDEEEYQQTAEQKADPVVTEQDASIPTAVPATAAPKTSQRDVLESNARRRPLILEQSPTVAQAGDGAAISEGLDTF